MFFVRIIGKKARGKNVLETIDLVPNWNLLFIEICVCNGADVCVSSSEIRGDHSNRAGSIKSVVVDVTRFREQFAFNRDS